MNATHTLANEWTRERHSINWEGFAADGRDSFLENLAADAADAAYQMAQRHGVGHEWLELQLDLWGVLTKEVENHDRVHSELLIGRAKELVQELRSFR